jgi:hypothetical protein
MCLYVYGDPAELFFVPVRSGPAGCTPRSFPTDRENTSAAAPGIDWEESVDELAVPPSRSCT